MENNSITGKKKIYTTLSDYISTPPTPHHLHHRRTSCSLVISCLQLDLFMVIPIVLFYCFSFEFGWNSSSKCPSSSSLFFLSFLSLVGLVGS